MNPFKILLVCLVPVTLIACKNESAPLDKSTRAEPTEVKAQYSLSKDQTHHKFSSEIPPVLRVPSGAVIEAYTEDASDEQFNAVCALWRGEGGGHLGVIAGLVGEVMSNVEKSKDQKQFWKQMKVKKSQREKSRAQETKMMDQSHPC